MINTYLREYSTAKVRQVFHSSKYFCKKTRTLSCVGAMGSGTIAPFCIANDLFSTEVPDPAVFLTPPCS